MLTIVPAIAAAFEKIILGIKEKSPRTRIYIQSVLPVNEKILGPRVNNRDVVDLNFRLKALADRRGLVYIDLYAVMLDSAGRLNRALTADGLHLNKRGYEVWKAVLEKYIRRID